MKKSLSCEEMGVAGCTFEVRSEKKEEIKDALMYHAQKIHPDKVGNLNEQQLKDMALQMDKMIH